MKIAQIRTFPVRVTIDVELVGLKARPTMSVCLVEITTQSGLTGYGMTAITQEGVVANAIEHVAAPQLLGEDALDHERLWEKLYWTLSPRGQTGYASHVIAALDTALWDIKGKALGLPVWRLLGGARERVQVYTTFGFPVFDRDQLAAAARHWLDQGHTQLKMVVGHQGLERRDRGKPLDAVIDEDIRRVRAVRDAIGPDVPLYLDANCSLDGPHAARICAGVADCGIRFFEEPITQNDAAQMADLRRRTGFALAAGQNEGLAFRFRDLLLAQAVDYLQPNVVISGGFTQSARIAALAHAFQVPVINGGAWPFHNMHLQGGVANGSLVEYHHFSVLVCQRLFRGLPEPENGWLTLPRAPGLGFEPDFDSIRELPRSP